MFLLFGRGADTVLFELLVGPGDGLLVGVQLGPGLAEDILGLVKNGRPVTEPEVFALFRIDRNYGKTEALK